MPIKAADTEYRSVHDVDHLHSLSSGFLFVLLADAKADKKNIDVVQKIAERVMKVLSNNMPANSGFAIGVIMGWRGVGLA